jgi:hypothetical protein
MAEYTYAEWIEHHKLYCPRCHSAIDYGDGSVCRDARQYAKFHPPRRTLYERLVKWFNPRAVP